MLRSGKHNTHRQQIRYTPLSHILFACATRSLSLGTARLHFLGPFSQNRMFGLQPCKCFVCRFDTLNRRSLWQGEDVVFQVNVRERRVEVLHLFVEVLDVLPSRVDSLVLQSEIVECPEFISVQVELSVPVIAELSQRVSPIMPDEGNLEVLVENGVQCLPDSSEESFNEFTVVRELLRGSSSHACRAPRGCVLERREVVRQFSSYRIERKSRGRKLVSLGDVGLTDDLILLCEELVCDFRRFEDLLRQNDESRT
jgi:hypothetical protein